MGKNFQNVLHRNVDYYHFFGVEDIRNLDLDPLLRDGDLLLGKNLVVPDPDGPTREETPGSRN